MDLHVQVIRSSEIIFLKLYFDGELKFLNGSFVHTGTLVGHVSATDRDEPYTLHTRVKYRIVSQSTSQMYHRSGIFAIDPDSGAITVAASLLDREVIFLM